MCIRDSNVHACRGRDRQWSPQRIADVIASAEPDIVALQELDVGRARSGGADQAEMIALALGMRAQFFPALRVMEELYGDAILTAWPSRLILYTSDAADDLTRVDIG